ncbi:MAG: porin family protein [Bacteroidota bacterium]
MKKILFVAIALLGTIAVSNAQLARFGVKAGANFSNLKVSTDGFGSGSPDGATSIYVGALVDFKLSDKFRLQPEALYSIEGADDADITYVDLPVMLKYYVVEGFNIQAGPELGILVDAEGGTDGLKSTNFSLNVGAAYDLPLGLFFDARYSFGLSDILDLTDQFGSELKTKGFQLGIGYKFN